MIETTTLKPAHIPILWHDAPHYQFKYLKKDGMDYYNSFCRGCGCDFLAKKVGIFLANLLEIGIEPAHAGYDNTYGPRIILTFADKAGCDIYPCKFPHPYNVTLDNTSIIIDQHPLSYERTKVWGNDTAFDEVTAICDLAGINADFDF